MRENIPEVADSTTSLSEYGVTCELRLLQTKLASAFSSHFCLDLCDDNLTASEQSERALLISDRYSSDLWNLEGVDG
jgi:hypothetical protein